MDRIMSTASATATTTASTATAASETTKKRIRRPVKALTAISLFSGAGGDTLGLERAGYRVVAFSEFKAPAIQTHQAAFPHSTLLVHPDPSQKAPTDLTKIPDEVFEAYENKVDLVFAGFPCQGFSHAGKKREEDPRNELVYQFARVVRLVKPRWIIGENVPGLLSRKGRDPTTQAMRPVIDIIRDIFEQIGYRIAYRVWKAVDHGVPQERKRLILIGAPMGKGWPSWPLAPSNQEMPSLRSFLEPHLEGAVLFPKENLPQGISPHYWISVDDETAQKGPQGPVHPNLLRLVKGIRGLTKKEREEQKQKQEQDQKQTEVAGGLISFGVRKSPYHGQILDPDLPSKTIICTYGVCPRLFVGLHHRKTDTYWVRTLSIKELAQIQGFPADYPWKGKEKEIITQIGNAVPPPLATAVVQSLSKVTFHEKEQKQEQEHTKEQEEEEQEEQEQEEQE